MPEKKTTKDTPYENNPFMVALQGINQLFDKARGIAILLLILSVVSVILNGFDESGKDGNKDMQLPNWPLEQWLLAAAIVAIVFLAALFIGSMVSGISAYTSLQIANGKKATLKEAFNAVLERFFSYIWLQILTTVKILLWTLLLVIPGIIMAYRYSLANIAFFDKGLRGNAAIKDSIKLTKGAWLTTFASQTLFDLITLGVISEVVNAGSRAILYRQFTAVKDGAKPDAHILSWLTVLLPLGVIVLALIVLGTFAAIFSSGGFGR